MRDRIAIAAALREMSSLLALKGSENRYRARAYERGAEAMERLDRDLEELVEGGRLTEITGIGDALAATITELWRTGTSVQLERLRTEVPVGWIELSQIDGLTDRRIEILRRELGVEDLAGLKAALASDALVKLKGFGAKAAEKIAKGVERYERADAPTLLVDALEAGDRLLRTMRTVKATVAADLAGETRRWHEAVPGVTIAAATASPAELVEKFTHAPEVVRIESSGEREATVRLASGVRASIVTAPPERWGAALIAATGSPEHVASLEERAARLGLSLAALEGRSEEDVYRALGLPFIAPELREGTGEIEAAEAGSLPSLVDTADVRGMVHCHTVYSDGKGTIEEMARAADALGVEYMTITDHSPSAFYARGLTVDRLKQQWDEIAEVQHKVKVRRLRGTESDILADGALDFPDPILEQLDVVIASIHSRFQMDEDKMTERLIRAMKHPVFKIWGHGLGRLVLRRDPIRCRVEEVLDAIAASRAAVEINGDPWRLDLEPKWIRAARERGIRFTISVDAHSTGALGYLPFGVHLARRAGVTKGEVLNALPAQRFAETVRPA